MCHIFHACIIQNRIEVYIPISPEEIPYTHLEELYRENKLL